MNVYEKVYCGVDVSKKQLDIFLQEKTKSFENTVKGTEALLNYAGNVHYVFEATGGYERLAAWLLMQAEATVSIINPARVRLYAKSMGILAKTDAIDAKMIHDYALNANPEANKMPSEKQRTLTVLVDRRQQLTDMLTAETNRLDTAGEPVLRQRIQKHIQWLRLELKEVEDEIQQTIKGDPEMRTKAERIQSIKGLGLISAVTILAHMPEIGTLSRRQVAALAGLAPYNRDSGGQSRKRHICGGRKRLRACLYMAAVCAIRHNVVMSQFYRRLVEVNHCPKKVALTAVMRKLLIAANSVIKNPEFIIAN